MTYSEKLRDPRWQRKRLEILTRDNWQCQSCGSKDKPLQVHHLVYSKLDPWEYPDYVFQTLCDDCHQVRHEMVDRLVDALRISLRDVPTQRLQIVSDRICSDAMKDL